MLASALMWTKLLAKIYILSYQVEIINYSCDYELEGAGQLIFYGFWMGTEQGFLGPYLF